MHTSVEKECLRNIVGSSLVLVLPINKVYNNNTRTSLRKTRPNQTLKTRVKFLSFVNNNILFRQLECLRSGLVKSLNKIISELLSDIKPDCRFSVRTLL